MRVDITSERIKQVDEWASAKPYKALSDKALKFLEVLSDGEIWQRTDLFRAAGYEANKISSGGSGYTDFTDYRLFMSGMIGMRATGVKGEYGWNGVQTFWIISENGLAALSASYLRRIA